MMNRRSSITGFLVLAALLASSASAYVLLSQRRNWDGVVNIAATIEADDKAAVQNLY